MCCRVRLDTRELLRRGGGLFGAHPLTGSIGVVTINMPRIGYLSESESDFFERLRKMVCLAAGSLSNNVPGTTNKTAYSILGAHELLINWFRIHLIQMERLIPQLSVNYLSPGFQSLAPIKGDRPPLLERVRTKNSQKEFIEFIPDGVFSITNEEISKTLLFFLEVDMGTETIASMDRDPKDIRQKILNFQALFHSSNYKRYEHIFNSILNGFRLLFLTNTASRLATLSRLVKEMPPSDFIWLTDQESMFTHGVSAEIWTKGGRYDDPPRSILGPKLACETPVLALIR